MLLTLGPLRAIAATTRETFISDALGFTFKYPSGWDASTLEQQIARHIAPDSIDDDILPVVIICRLKEPTPTPNQNFGVVAYEPWDVDVTEDYFETFEAACKATVVNAKGYIGGWSGEASELAHGIKIYKFSYRTLSADGAVPYQVKTYVWYNRVTPLAFFHSAPVGEDSHELDAIITSLRPH